MIYKIIIKKKFDFDYNLIKNDYDELAKLKTKIINNAISIEKCDDVITTNYVVDSCEEFMYYYVNMSNNNNKCGVGKILTEIIDRYIIIEKRKKYPVIRYIIVKDNNFEVSLDCVIDYGVLKRDTASEKFYYEETLSLMKNSSLMRSLFLTDVREYYYINRNDRNDVKYSVEFNDWIYDIIVYNERIQKLKELNE